MRLFKEACCLNSGNIHKVARPPTSNQPVLRLNTYGCAGTVDSSKMVTARMIPKPNVVKSAIFSNQTISSFITYLIHKYDF